MAYEAAAQISNTYSEYLGKLPGVISSNVVFNDGELVEIHILADTSRSPKQIVRDIQSLFMAQFNKEIDHRIVSIAQIEYNVKPNSQDSARFVLEGVTVGKKRNETEIEVALSMDEKTYLGKYTALKDSIDIYRGIAQATLSAVSLANEAVKSFSILEVRFIDVAGERMAVTCVTITSPENSTGRFTGTAFSKNDDEMAIVKATLNAINRRIGHF